MRLTCRRGMAVRPPRGVPLALLCKHTHTEANVKPLRRDDSVARRERRRPPASTEVHTPSCRLLTCGWKPQRSVGHTDAHPTSPDHGCHAKEAAGQEPESLKPHLNYRPAFFVAWNTSSQRPRLLLKVLLVQQHRLLKLNRCPTQYNIPSSCDALTLVIV
jgi:hypothetical protein